MLQHFERDLNPLSVYLLAADFVLYFPVVITTKKE